MTTSDKTGWYEENPVTITATVTCPEGGPDCPHPFTLAIETAEGSRFYFLDRDVGDDQIPVECYELLSGSDYSHTGFIDSCIRVPAVTALTLFAGESKTLSWRIWVQPSDTASINVTAVWGGAPLVKSLSVNRANIHPVVFVHGILGSQPPGNTVIDYWPQWDGGIIDFNLGPHLDPFIGSYKPLIDNLLRMGYEIDRTVFPVTYDWRRSNINSAAWLRWVLNMRVGAYGVSTLAEDLTYADRDGKADVIVHSMGGLVLRTYVAGKACEGDPEAQGAELLDYQDNVHNAIFIASPHRGFPFDYKTLHGLTWHEYTDDQVPAALGGTIRTILGLSTDWILWPYLIMCRYDAPDDQPCNNPKLDLWSCNTSHRQALYDYSRSDPFDPDHPGIGSLREMIPDKWAREYLQPKEGWIEPAAYLCAADESGCTEKYGREENFLLDSMDLNSAEARLSLMKLGSDGSRFDGIYVLYNRNFRTTARYRVTEPDPLPPKGLPDYPDYEPRFRRWHEGGKPDTTGGREWRNGDGLIPHWSTRLFYSRGLLAGQLSWSDLQNQELHIDDADHVMIAAAHQTQSVIGAILTGMVEPADARNDPMLFPVYSPYEAPTQILDNLDVYISFLANCPENPGEEE